MEPRRAKEGMMSDGEAQTRTRDLMSSPRKWRRAHTILARRAPSSFSHRPRNHCPSRQNRASRRPPPLMSFQPPAPPSGHASLPALHPAAQETFYGARSVRAPLVTTPPRFTSLCTPAPAPPPRTLPPCAHLHLSSTCTTPQRARDDPLESRTSLHHLFHRS